MWYGYFFHSAGRVVWVGITQDLERREREHQERWPSGYIVKKFGPASEVAARAWEKSHHDRGYPGG